MFHNYDMIQFVSGTQLDFYFFSLAGVVVKEETRELLVIQERNSSVSCVPVILVWFLLTNSVI